MRWVALLGSGLACLFIGLTFGHLSQQEREELSSMANPLLQYTKEKHAAIRISVNTW
jgi:hypothetical protein